MFGGVSHSSERFGPGDDDHDGPRRHPLAGDAAATDDTLGRGDAFVFTLLLLGLVGILSLALAAAFFLTIH